MSWCRPKQVFGQGGLLGCLKSVIFINNHYSVPDSVESGVVLYVIDVQNSIFESCIKIGVVVFLKWPFYVQIQT